MFIAMAVLMSSCCRSFVVFWFIFAKLVIFCFDFDFGAVE